MSIHVTVVVIQQLAVGRFEIGGINPVAGHNARQRHADVGGTIQPAGTGPASQPLTYVIGEMVAVAREDVVGRAVELERSLMDDGVDLGLGGEGHALYDLGSKCATRWIRLGRRPIHTRYTPPIMAAVRVFFAVDDHAGVEERCTDNPQSVRETAGLVRDVRSGYSFE